MSLGVRSKWQNKPHMEKQALTKPLGGREEVTMQYAEWVDTRGSGHLLTVRRRWMSPVCGVCQKDESGRFKGP